MPTLILRKCCPLLKHTAYKAERKEIKMAMKKRLGFKKKKTEPRANSFAFTARRSTFYSRGA